MATKWLRLNLLAPLLLLASPLFADELQPLTINDFSAGLQTRKDSVAIDVGAAQDCENVDVHTGKIETRRGSVKQNATTLGGFTGLPVRLEHEYPDTSGNNWLISVTSNSIYGSKDSGATNTLLTSTHGVTSSSVFSAVNAYNNCYLTDGTTNWLIFNGSMVTSSTSPPHGTVVAFYAERLWTAGVSGDRSALHYSYYGDPLNWTDADTSDSDAGTEYIRKDNGYGITALVQDGPGLVIFKDYSMDMIATAADGLSFYRTPISDTIGTTHPNSARVVNGELIFLSADGYMAYNFNTNQIRPIDFDIQPTVQSIRQMDSSSRSVTYTTQGNFEAGTTNYISASYSSGDIMLSTWTDADGGYGDSANADWSSGTCTGGWSVANEEIIPTGTQYYITFNYSHSTGTFTSRAFDTSFSTPAWLSSSYDCAAGSTNTFHVWTQSSSDGITWDTTTTWNSGSSPMSSFKRYIRYVVDMTTHSPSGYGQPSCYNISLAARSSTGSWASDSFSLGSISSWGLFSKEETLNGGAITYALYTDSDTTKTVTNGVPVAGTWVSSQTITANTVPTVSTNSYGFFTTYHSITSSTQNPTASMLDLQWYEGSGTFPVWSLEYEGDYLSSVAIDSTVGNDKILVYDRNGRWTKYSGLNAYCMTKYRQKPYIGSYLQGSICRIQADDVTNDAGTAISSYWTSKDFDMGFPATDKSLQRYYITAKRIPNSDVTFSYGVNRGTLYDTVLDLDAYSGFYRKAIIPSSLTYSKGIQSRFKISDSDLDDTYSIYSITAVERLETAP